MSYLQLADVSAYQTTTPVGCALIIAKASEGTTPDGMFATHIATTKSRVQLTGAYHFNYGPGQSAAAIDAQAAFFLSQVAAVGGVDSLWLDVEGGNAFTHAQAAEFIAYVHKAGHKIGLYASLSVFFDAGQDWDWVAYYNPTPPARHWNLWQYGPYQGADGDRFAGTAAQLRTLLNAPAPQPYVWGSDVPGNVRHVTYLKRVHDAIVKAFGGEGIHSQGAINLGDLDAANRKVGLDPGSSYDPSDLVALLRKTGV